MTPDEQIIPGFDRFPGLASAAIDLYMPCVDRLGGKPACSEEPACPQPLVQPLCSQWASFSRGWFRVHGLRRVLHRGLQGKLPRNQPLLNGSFRFAPWMLTIWDGSGPEWEVPPIGGINGRVPEGVPPSLPGVLDVERISETSSPSGGLGSVDNAGICAGLVLTGRAPFPPGTPGDAPRLPPSTCPPWYGGWQTVK